MAGLMGWILVLTAGLPEAAESYLRSAEEAFALHPDPGGQARLVVLRCKLQIARGEAETLAGARRIFRMLKQALAALAAGDDLFRIAALIMQGNARCWAGDIPGSVRTLREALRVCRQTIARHSDEAGRPHPAALAALLQQGVLELAANRLNQAQRPLEQGLELARRLGWNTMLAVGLVVPPAGRPAGWPQSRRRCR